MSQEGSPVPGTSVQAFSGVNFRSLIKESLLEVLRENPEVLRPATGGVAEDQSQQQSSNRDGGKCAPLDLLWYTPSEHDHSWLVNHGRICKSDQCSRICKSDHVGPICKSDRCWQVRSPWSDLQSAQRGWICM